MDLTDFATEVGVDDPVSVTGAATRGGPVAGVRVVRPPAGIEWIQADEMTVCCGAGTPVDELAAALDGVGQRVNLPDGGTVGGALAIGATGIRRLGHGSIRDTVLQARYVDAGGRVITAGGPTVKNVSGFDLCRLLVGSRGTLGFLGEVILRTRPRPRAEQWYVTEADPWELMATLYRPTSILWNGQTTHVLLEGHPSDLAVEAGRHGLMVVEGPPPLPTGARWSIPPSRIRGLTGEFVAEVGVGIVHGPVAPQPPAIDPAVARLHRAIKDRFDPTSRLNPGVAVIDR